MPRGTQKVGTIVVASSFRRVARSDALRRAARGVIGPTAALMPDKVPRPPVIVIGCPRSGTSLLAHALALSSDLASLRLEGHALWEAFNHPSRHGWHSNALGPEHVTTRERRYVYTTMRVLAGRRRFIDKTPKNCLRVPYLNELFPEATFVFLTRRAADNVNSLIEGWRAWPRFVSYHLPERLEGLGALAGPYWSFVLTPGWRELKRASLEEVCAAQYVEANEAMLRARPSLEPHRIVDVSYEAFVSRPVEELTRIYAEVGIPLTDSAVEFARSLPPVNALTPPRPGKWRDQNPAEIGRILPLVAATERRLGYPALDESRL